MTAAPHRTTRTFAPEPVSAREARRFLRAFLVARNREDLTDAAELALSEVVTNAVLHAHTSFDVTAELAEDGELRVEVADLDAYKHFHTEVLGALPQVSTITSYIVMESTKDERR